MPESRRRAGGAFALFVALVAGGLLILLPGPRTAPTDQRAVGAAGGTEPVVLSSLWPGARVASAPARLDDGTRFTPRLYLDLDTAVGTAPTADGAAVRILLRRVSGVTELRRVPRDVNPEIGGFTASGDVLVWGELTYPPGVDQVTRLWRVDWRAGGAPTLLTADGGYAVFYQTQFDIEIVADVVYWVTTTYNGLSATQVRALPLSGGSVSTVREERGTYALSSWPWMVTPQTGRLDPVRMVNIETGEQRPVPHAPGELLRCSPTWCRAGISAAVRLVRIDLMRPDGADRRRIAGGEATPVLNDVALLDRFEVLFTDGDPTPAPGRPAGQHIVLYDLSHDRTVLLDTGVADAATGGGLLWWSVGDDESTTWKVLDLGALSG
jgi:hypothetical protein